VSSEEKRGPLRSRREGVILMVTLLLVSRSAFLGAQTPLEEAIGLYQNGHLQEAQERFQILLTEDPQGAEALYYLGKIEVDADKSLEYRQKFLSLHPDHPKAAEVLYGVAQYNFALGYYLTAARDYQKLLRTYPDSDLATESLYWLASSKLAIGAPDSARFYFHRLLDDYGESPMVPWAELGLVDALFMAQGFSLARAQCRVFLEAHPQSTLLPVALFRFAEIHEALGEREAAQGILRQLVDDYPDTYQGDQARRQLTEWGELIGKSEEPEVQEGGYTVQVGAFSNRANALNLETQLRTEGYQVEVVKKAGQHRSLYLVWVGLYGSREEALREAQLLEKQRGLPYQIIKK
jgi:TolA-binding protein